MNMSEQYARYLALKDKETEQALYWLEESATQGYAKAQKELGDLNFQGKDVDLDPKTAANWYEKAAEQGFSAAQLDLGKMYQEGTGVRKDKVLAYKWVSLSQTDIDGNQEQILNNLISEMNAEAILKAESLVKDFKPAISENFQPEIEEKFQSKDDAEEANILAEVEDDFEETEVLSKEADILAEADDTEEADILAEVEDDFETSKEIENEFNPSEEKLLSSLNPKKVHWGWAAFGLGFLLFLIYGLNTSNTTQPEESVAAEEKPVKTDPVAVATIKATSQPERKLKRKNSKRITRTKTRSTRFSSTSRPKQKVKSVAVKPPPIVPVKLKTKAEELGLNEDTFFATDDQIDDLQVVTKEELAVAAKDVSPPIKEKINFKAKPIVKKKKPRIKKTISAKSYYESGLKEFNNSNYTKALSLFKKSAKSNYPAAQNYIGLMYSQGKGVTRDYRKAIAWYEKAAWQNYKEAQFNLGVMYFKGNGIGSDLIMAYKWVSLSGRSRNNELVAKQRRAMTQLKQWMTEEEISTAKQLMSQFRPRTIPEFELEEVKGENSLSVSNELDLS